MEYKPKNFMIEEYQGARSLLEPLTNTAVIQINDFPAAMPLLLRGMLPKELLFKFLHEFTHYWTFDTNVGLALHLLFIGAYRPASDINVRLAKLSLGKTLVKVEDQLQLAWEMISGLERPRSRKEKKRIFKDWDRVSDHGVNSLKINGLIS